MKTPVGSLPLVEQVKINNGRKVVPALPDGNLQSAKAVEEARG